MSKPDFITLTFGKDKLIIDKIGATIADYRTENDARIIFSYGKNRSSCEVSQGYVLFPFPGRVENGKYKFEGQNNELKAPCFVGKNAIHGFAFNEEWNIKKTSENKCLCCFDLKEEDFGPKGFPFSLKIEIIYELKKNGLIVDSKVTNVSKTKNAPFGLGFHPFFCVENKTKTQKVDDFKLLIPGKKLMEFDSNLKPTGKLLNVKDKNIIEKGLSFIEKVESKDKKPIGNVKLDHCFTDLVMDENGISKTEIINKDIKDKKITIWQDGKAFPYIQAYSYDFDISKNNRSAIAIEPQTCCGFALNVDNVGLRVLKPGEVFSGKWGVDFKY